MLKIHLLGTSGMQPLPKRALASALIMAEKGSILIDAGEGTQISLRRYGSLIKRINYVLITHLHLDHVGGIPGVLQAIANTGRSEPVTFVGPGGLKSKIKASREFVTQLPFEVKVMELNRRNLEHIKLGNVEIQPFECQHSIACFGYNIVEKRGRKFLIDKVISTGILKEDYSRIVEGRPVFINGKSYPATDFLGPERKGLKISYCTDTRPTEGIMHAIHGADLLVCEGMYPDERFLDKALTNKHMLATEAANLANDAGVKELWLTHFSPIIEHPETELSIARTVFTNTKIGYSGLVLEFNFEKEE